MSNTAGSAAPDVAAVISRLFIYPIKSCAGIEAAEAILTETGLEFDRAWMVVDEHGVYLTQRTVPRMALVKPQLRHFDMVLRAPGMLALHVSLNEVESPVRVRIWSDEVAAFDMGALAAQWFSDYLGVSARLVRFDPAHRRLSSREWTGEVEAPNQFSDGFPLLAISEASLTQLNQKLAAAGEGAVGMERFRPNIVLGDLAGLPGAAGMAPHDEDRVGLIEIATGEGVVRLKPVKPCKRCPIPNIDPATATSSPVVGDMLQSYRQDPRLNGAITFGMNLVVLNGVDCLLKPGQGVIANYDFDQAL